MDASHMYILAGNVECMKLGLGCNLLICHRTLQVIFVKNNMFNTIFLQPQILNRFWFHPKFCAKRPKFSTAPKLPKVRERA